MKKFLYLSLIAIVLVRCGKNEPSECATKPDGPVVKVNVKIQQFQDSLANVKSKKELVGILTRQPLMRDYIFRRSEYPGDSVFINELYQRFTHPYIDTLLLETRKVFGDLSDLESQFSEAFTNIKYYYPDFVPPVIQSVISLPDTDLLVTDSLIIVSLDHFLGPKAKYRPKVYDYMLRRYDPDDIVPSCVLLFGIGEKINKSDMKDKTVLAEMIAYGKAFYFTKHMMPCTPDSVLMWYTADDIKGARENEDLIWARFIQDKVLFSTSMIEKRNYLGERPFTIQVGEKCPGRIGQWVGWQIVNQYMKTNDEVSLPQLMKMDDAQKLFKDSHYKPQSR
jgi:hypothetical protein